MITLTVELKAENKESLRKFFREGIIGPFEMFLIEDTDEENTFQESMTFKYEDKQFPNSKCKMEWYTEDDL